MKRAAIYARFSSDRQNGRSIDDQIAACRELCQREGWALAAVFSDRAISGANAVNRVEFLAMIEAAEAGRFDVLVTEDIDRLIRDQGDYHAARKRLDFAGVPIHTLAGRVGKIEGSLRALTSEMFLDNLAVHTRRGMEGVIRDGRHAGGRAYGYMAVPGRPGELAIVEDEADVLRGIFADYVAGRTPREIASRLNAAGVKPPRGRHWNASTINGNLARGSGIILNELYAGRIVWNKVSMMKDPATGRRISRANPKEKHRSVEAPHLRIIDAATWEAAQAVKSARSVAKPAQARRPPRFLSGLVRCGVCGGSMSSAGGNYRTARLQCSRGREAGVCSNKQRVSRDKIEQTVLAGLRDNLTRPAVIAEYAAEYNRERARLARSSGAKLAQLERAAGENARELERAIDAIVKLGVAPEAMADRIRGLEAERLRLAGEVAAAKASPKVIALHPASIERYRSDVVRLAGLLDKGRDGECDELIAAVRALVAAVVVRPTSSGHAVEVQGRLSQLTETPAFPSLAACMGSVVAGGRYSQSHTPGPVFRLHLAA